MVHLVQGTCVPARGCDRIAAISKALGRVDDLALVIDVAHSQLDIVAVSSGFCHATGYEACDVVGCSLQTLHAGAPVQMISKSGQKTLEDFCRTCSSKEVDHIAETTVTQPVARKDGSHFSGTYLVGLFEHRCMPYILAVLAESDRRRKQEQYESLRTAFLRIRKGLNGYDKQFKFLSDSSFGSTTTVGTQSESEATMASRLRNSTRLRTRQHWSRRGHRREKALKRLALKLPDFAFFAERLDNLCVLSNEGYTASRREPSELNRGCVVFSDTCLKLGPLGFEFSLRVDGVEPKWKGLPILGFTRRLPTDSPKLYPHQGNHLAQSVLVGFEGNGFARDQESNWVVGFKRPSQEEIAVWQGDWPTDGISLSVGDVLRCVYLRSGSIQLWLNGTQLWDFDTTRPIDTSEKYYAVVDVCFTATSLTVLPSTVANTQTEAPHFAQYHAFAPAERLPTIHTHEMLPTIPTLDSLPTIESCPNIAGLVDGLADEDSSMETGIPQVTSTDTDISVDAL